MKRTFSAKRIPRKIAADDDESPHVTDASQGTADSGKAQESVVKRPVLGKTKKRSSLRLSFGPGEASTDSGDDQSDSAVFTPKKSNLSRIAIANNAERKARSSLASELAQPRANLEDGRPSYSKDYIAELRGSTPSTPKNIQSGDEGGLSKQVDIASKFGPLATLSGDEPFSLIPTQTEIQEKKERRARLAKEHQAYISLDGDDGDDNWASDVSDEFRTNRNEISLRPKGLKEKYEETRLVPEDEDMAEGFDDFVEDGRISLGRKAEREAKKKRRAEMAELIAEAEQPSDDDGSADSEAERNAAFEAAQTRAGTSGQPDKDVDGGDKTPPKITPLPDLDQVLEKLQSELRAKEQMREQMLKRMEDLRNEKTRIAERQQYVQEQLRETGEKYEKLRQEAGMAALPTNGLEGGKMIVNRGLDSLGATPVPTEGERSSDEN
ncbi:hypothetical protein GQ43DRAFT_463170 [Delitschia confertaspora ATCC 74209]|uniref:Uncharacterized protein n=1 Tax=Delitschia confertaspora ATCC 74209 TaxID=1513339 RepID=A0A9P4JLU5_9PLEO|nr:hypothetical protein GQ43DRAFT_463170 [Delitschia confertaspora ATCC 74209]